MAFVPIEKIVNNPALYEGAVIKLPAIAGMVDGAQIKNIEVEGDIVFLYTSATREPFEFPLNGEVTIQVISY